MECTINDINLSFDKDNRLRSTIGRVSGWSVDKAIMLAAQLQTESFKSFLKENLLPTDIIKDAEVDINNIKDEDYVNIKQNKFGSLLNAYYLKTYHSVNNSKTNRGAGRLMGFSSSNAKGIAKNYVADLIIDKYQENLNKPREVRKDNSQIIREVIDEIDNAFLKRADEFANNIISTDKYNNAAKEYARKFLDVTSRMDVTKQEANNLYYDIQSTIAQINKMNKRKLTKGEREAYDALKQNYEESNARHKNLTKAFYQLKRDRAIMAMNLINLYSSNIDAALSERNKNFLNLYLQVKGNPNQFFFEVFHTKKMTNLVKEYDKLGDINEYEEADEDNDDIITDKFNDQSTDETSKSWEDNLYKNFNQSISTKMRFILARVPKLAAPFNPTETEPNYNTENELGVRTYYDPSYLILQIHTFADFSSAEAMINSLDSKSKEIKALYGLGELVNQMRQDREFANYCYANFAKPLVNKVMVTINAVNAENGIEFDYSNPNAFNEVKLGFDMLNKLRATYNTNYDINDSKTLISLDKQLRSKGVESVREKFQEVLLKYFPNFDSTAINNIFKLNNAADIVTGLIRNLNIVVQESGNIKKRINDEYDTINREYNNAVREWNDKYAEAAQNPANKDKIPNYPTRREFNPVLRDLTPTINKAVLSFAHTISQYNESHARMNTANAAGNTASDIIKNNFISRFFDMILAEDGGDPEAGLKALGQYLMQGCEDGRLNQYSNNPLFFGLKDANGQIVRGYEGMFRREGDSAVPNPNAKQILKYALFDGVRNNNTEVGTVYDKMSKIDFFITQYIAFGNSLAEHTVESGNTKEVNGRPTAVYPMRIGSDAPKIFMIRAPRYSMREANLAIYNHFLDELTMFVQGVNNLFEIDEAGNYVTKRNVNGLISRAYFDEREADKIKNANGTDFTKAIVKQVEREIDGKKVKRLELVGNMFKFLRLFDISNNEFGANIEQALSLYGPDSEAKPALFVNNGDGRLRINRAYINKSDSFIKFNTETNRFELSLDDTLRVYFLREVNKWSNDFLASAKNEIGDYIEALKEQGISYTDAALDEFLLNSIVMNMNYDDMFEGDFKYYNSARDFLKRTKETQAGGDAYDNVSMVDSTNEITESTWNGQPAVINVKQSKGSNASAYTVPTFNGKTIVDKPMIARNGWRAVTIRNVVRPADEAQLLQDTLEKQFIKEGMDKERAHNRAVKIAAGYWANTKANDAQSYITLEEFIRRRDADGTLNEYQDILAQLLDPNISAADINLDEINARIQVQKNFYYDKVYDPDTRQFIPRQIKNAEFVLIPKLLPEGSELIKVYNWMRANDIGQLNTAETDKAAKKNILDIWIDSKDEEGNSIIKFIDPNTNPNFDNSYIQNYKYKYLYKQQDVSQHMLNEQNKLGAQISKKILDNVSTAPKEVQTWADEYQEAYTENIRQDFINFITTMGWELDSNRRLVNSEYATTDAEGNPLDANTIELNRTVLNLDRYYARARQEAIRLGMDSNFMEYLTTDEFGRPLMPNSMNNVQQKLESVGQALFNRAVTRQVLPGWHAAQITGVGYSHRLRFDAKTGVMEVYLPRWSKLIPRGKTPEEDAAILKQIQEEHLDIHLGYRIPTEGKQSISVLRVVGFTPDCLGSTIVVPDAWVTQTGSDFDVDSIYGICWEMYASHGKDGKVKLHKIPYEREDTDDRMLYINYVNERLDTKVKRDNLGNEINDKIKSFKDNIRSLVKDAKQQRKGLSEEYDKQDEIRNNIYKKRLPAWARGIIKDENATAKRKAKENKVVVDLTDAYPAITEKLVAYLDNHNLPVEEVNAVHDYIDQMTTLLNIINAQRGVYSFNKDDYYAEKTDTIKQIIEDNVNNWLTKVQDAAKETGLISFDEFKELPYIQKLSRRARNNYILDRMIKIMNDDSSREEQYGRSQFEDIAGEDHSANTVIDRISGTTSKLISPYNPLTQLDYFDDAMGGAELKAISVTWDNFVSKSNRVHGVLSDNDAITAILNLDGPSAKGSAITYNEKDINDAFKDTTKKFDSKTDRTIGSKETIVNTNNIDRQILIDELGETPVYISESRIKKLQKITSRIDEDDKIFYVDWRIFAPYNYNLTFKHHYTHDGSEGIRTYKTTSEIVDLIYNITNKYPKFVKGKQPMTQAIWDLLTSTTPNEFFAIIDNYDEINDYNTNAPIKERKITMKVINDFIKKGEKEGIIYTDENIANIIKNINLSNKKISSKFRAPISKDLIDSKTFKEKYPKSHAIAVELYNAENNISNIGTTNTNQVTVKLNKFGWSNNNKGVTGNYITTSTVETSAHHLDAIKSGSIPGVNPYTFGVYKLITCVGLDHEFSVGFIRQPIIQRLVSNYNLTQSIYFGGVNDPINMTFADIASDLGLTINDRRGNPEPITKNTYIGAVVNALKTNLKFINAFYNIFGVDISKMENNDILSLKFPLRKDYIFQRIETAGKNGTNKIDRSQATAYNQAAVDFSMLIMFRQMNNTVFRLNNIIQFSAVDKIGAKPSIRETRRIQENIDKYRTDGTITVGDKSWADAVFPKDSNGNIDVDASVNKPIAAAYAYATLPSLQVGKQVFITENDDYIEAERYTERIIGRRLNEQEYKEWRRYAMLYLYNSIKKLLTPLCVDEQGRVMYFRDETSETDTELKTAELWNPERSRIVGYGVVDESDFNVEDINKPTDAEIAAYTKLTPAQKVLFVQRNFPDNQGIFNYLKVTMISNANIRRQGISRQYISYDDQVDSIEDLFLFFENSFDNKNPLVKLAMVDLIKYAFVAEGFNFRSGYITKIIINSSLYNDFNRGGMDIINSTDVNDHTNDGIVNRLRTLPNELETTDFVELYVRSHPDIIKTSRINSLNSREGRIFRAGIRIDGLIHLDNTIQETTNQSLIKRLKVKKNVDGYVRIDFPTNGTNRATALFYVAGANPLYKTDKDGSLLIENGEYVIADYQDYFLIPLNQLEPYECYTNSYNANYNKFNDVEYYNALVEELERATAAYRFDQKHNPNPNSKYKPIKAPVGKYIPSTGNLEEAMENPEALSSMYFSADNFIRGGVRMLVDDIRNNYLTRVAEGNPNAIYILNNNSIIGRYIPVGKYATQTITDNNGQPYSVTIAHIPAKAGVRRILKLYIDNKGNPTGKEADELQFIINRLRETNTSPIAANIYRVAIAKQPKETIDDNIRKAATIEIDDIEADTVDRAGVDAGLARRGIEIDSTSSAIIRQITYDARKNNSAIANEFVRNIERRGVNRNYRSSLREHRANIYTAAARYYQSAANAILNNIDRYKIGDDYYDLSTPEAYEALAEFTEEFGNVARILLDALTFGNRIDTIFNLDIATEDKETKDAIENIRRTINKVRTNTKIQRALSNIINVYFKKYSTNPLIVDGLMQLRDTFGDTDNMIKYIFDAAESHSPEVQVILKQVYTSFSKAEMFETQHNLKEWRDDIAKIDAMTESLDMSKVIDFNSWRLKQDYNEDYIKERDRILNEYNEAKRNRFDSVEAYGNYLRKQLARDKFNYEHKEQPIVAEYYKEDIENRERALERGGKSYIKYRMLSAQLYELKRIVDENNEEEMNQITNIKTQMNALKSITDAVGSEKAPHLKQAAEAINDYIAKRREILEKYFDSKEYDGFQETYSRYNSFIKSYDNKHSEESLTTKLENPEYSEAYNWIKTNGHLGYTKEAADKIAEAFKKLVGRTTSMSARTRIRLKNINGAIDDAGIINPTVLTDEQIDLIRQEEESELASKYANGEGEIILIKEVPKNTPVTLINKKVVKYKYNSEKMRVIGRINEILSKAVNHDNGHIDIATLFNNDYVTDAEREELGRLYSQLYNFNEAEDELAGKVFTYEINEDAYNNAMTYYHTHLERTKQGRQFLNIFTFVSAAGQLRPNRFIYGFKAYKDEYIDQEKTAALNFIRDNIEYVPSEYYYQAMKEASDNGTYEEWFNRNHIYNPFSHKYEPLKIWTIMQAKPDSELAKQTEYIPSFDNMERSVKKEYINNAENRKRLGLTGEGYKEFGTNYKRGDSRFDSNINRNAKEQAMYDLVQRTLTKYASTYQSKRFVGQGYLPREREVQVNGKWMATQLAALFGMSWHSNAESDSFSETVDYSHDRDADMDMLNFLKGKGSKQYKHIPIRADYKTDEEYEADVAKVREENRKIAEENRKIDAGIVSKNFRKVMEDFVYNATIFNSRQAAKPYLYLLLEDLQRNDAYKLKAGWNRHLIKDYDRSTSDDPQYRMTRQRNTYDLIHNLARRLLFNQYHEKSTMRNVANFLQNLTSAKFMVFNLYGGIANVTTGSVNIAMEQFANDYFGVNDFRKAQGKYLSNSAAILASAFTDKARNLEAALCKQFKVVDFDQVLQFGATSDNLDAKMRKVRDFLYSFQSMGEHYMQNSVMFAMLKSNRIYTDTQGNIRIGDFKDFTTGIEVAALRDVLASRPDLLMNFQMYIDSIRNYDVEKRLELSMGRTSIVRSFLYTLRDNVDPAINSSYEKIATEFNARRKDMMKEARTQFNENPTVESIYEYKDGQAVVKKEVIEKLKPQLGEDAEEKLETMLAELREKVKAVNKKIHGVYDKNGAALLENTWWGSILMQYHKHLPMGILKRYRRRGYYSEFRGSMERGTYQSIIDFLGTEFTNFKNRTDKRVKDGTNIALASLQTVFESALNTIHHLKLNWGNLDNWEQANIKRNLAEVGGVLAACLIVIALYGLSDDDDINDDRFKASCLYLADRLYSETTMYGPQGLVSEYNTAKNNPLASMSIVNDLVKAMTLTSQYLLDPNYNPEYQTGRYAGENKLEVLLKRNISGYRSYDRILMINKNNNYYKVGESQIGINIAKNFGELLNE